MANYRILGGSPILASGVIRRLPGDSAGARWGVAIGPAGLRLPQPRRPGSRGNYRILGGVMSI